MHQEAPTMLTHGTNMAPHRGARKNMNRFIVHVYYMSWYVVVITLKIFEFRI